MAGITISGMDEQKKNPVTNAGENKKPATGTGTGSTGVSGVTVTAPTSQKTEVAGVTTKDAVNSPVKVTVKAGDGTNKNLGMTSPNMNVGAVNGANAAANAETSLADLRNQYASQLRDNFNYTAEKLKAERDDALRENWILQQQAEAALPEQMAARGMNGGATETTLADLRARYQGDRNQLRGDYMDEMGDLAQNHNQQIAEQNRSYNERWLEYLLNLAEMEEQHKKNKELRALS